MDKQIAEAWARAFREAWAEGREIVLINPVNGDRTWIND